MCRTELAREICCPERVSGTRGKARVRTLQLRSIESLSFQMTGGDHQLTTLTACTCTLVNTGMGKIIPQNVRDLLGSPTGSDPSTTGWQCPRSYEEIALEDFVLL